MKASKMQQELVKCVQSRCSARVDADHRLDTRSGLYRWMMNTTTPTGWALPVLYQVCQDLKRIAMLVSFGLESRYRSAAS